jgi:uncharacterized SAM-binding protein YcdF (DUF218 family)
MNFPGDLCQMFFILSKLLAFLLKPLNLIVFAALGAWLMRSPRWRQRSLWACVILFVVFTNKALVNLASGGWETGYRSIESIEKPYQTGIVSGGFANFKAAGPVLNFTQSGNRITTALLLYQQGKIERILISGGTGGILDNSPAEATEVRKWLLAVGVPDAAILVEAHSRNTRENALFSKALLDSLGLHQRPLLITSAWHLRRAEGCFQKVGLPCDLFGTDYFHEKTTGNSPFRWIEPDYSALMHWEVLIKEWVGYAVYRLKKYV